MSPYIIVVVYWCTAAAPIDTFDPHHLDAVSRFVRANPVTCHVTEGEAIARDDNDMGITLAECRARQMISYMPGWLQRNPGKIYLGADCFEHDPARPEPLSLQALKERVSP